MVCGFHPKPFVVSQGGGLRNRTYYKGPVRGGVVLGGGAFDQHRVLCNRLLNFQEPRGVDRVIVFLFFLLLLLLLLLLWWKAAKNTGETTNAETPNAFGGGRCALPPNPPPAFLFLRFPPLNVVAAAAVVVVVVVVAVAVVVVVVVNSKTPQKEENNICRAAQCIWGGGSLPQFNPQLFFAVEKVTGPPPPETSPVSIETIKKIIPKKIKNKFPK